MSEENPTPEAAGEEKASPAFAIKRVYLKDLSFETPMGIEAFNQNQPPKVEQELNVQVTKIDEAHHEVVLLLTVTAKIEDRTAFLIEVKQAGVFNITGLSGVQMAQTINSTCPNILFPYARETIDSVLSRGTFAALMLPPINFDAVFAQAIAQQKQQQQAASESAQTDA
ncbi:protein-export chaperone SecB [uncultured Gilvimarinus sp.]|uniref:protein-export chaperone SecB n=1 Tax=uncultured Gilvimarinus sp. TaxID=1689143 RepID=UPI0030EE2E40|tara:strand:+ start:4025 stop:4531 length:507 start_codon:yes stop_codon:yes gene_type:complete